MNGAALRWQLVAGLLLVSCGSPPPTSTEPPKTPVAATYHPATPPTFDGEPASPVRSSEPQPPPAETVASGTRLNPPQSGGALPDGRGAAQVAYDTTLGQLVLFGGNGASGPTADTWVWKSGKWSWVRTDVAPVERALGAFIYDPVRRVSLLFGGAAAGSWVDSPLNDTWSFDGARWTQLVPANSPSPRSGAAVTFDSTRGLVVMYGGYAGQNNFLNDVWTWDGANWTKQTSSLPALYPLGLGYRAADDSMQLVGQATSAAGISHQVQTWRFAGGSWSETRPAGTPPCLDHYGASSEDRRSGSLVFFGGYCPNATVVWNGSAWSSSTPNPSPVARGNEAGAPAMIYDPDVHGILLFGGVANGVYYNDLWEWDGSGWTKSG